MGLSKEVVSNVQNVVERQACAAGQHPCTAAVQLLHAGMLTCGMRSAAGQEVLMSTYDMMFNRLGLKSAQVLITQSDFQMTDRYG